MPTYYVKSGGNDLLDGLSPANAWETINKVNGEAFDPGDGVLFHRGDTWNEQLTMPSSGAGGARIAFGAYGSGDRPLLYGLTTETGFVIHAGNIYKKIGFVVPGTLMTQCFEDGERLIYAANLGAVVQGSYFFDDGNDILYIWSTDDADPDTHTIERPNCTAGIDFNGETHITADNIDAYGQALQGFSFRTTAGSTDITVTNCTASFAGSRGFDCGGYAVLNLSDILIEDCVAYNHRSESFWIGNGTRIGVVNCEAYDCTKDTAEKSYPFLGVGGIVVGIRAVDCYVTGNYIHDIYTHTPLWVEHEATYARPLRSLIKRNLIVTTRATYRPSKGIWCEGQDSVYENNIVRFHGDQAAFWVDDGSQDESFYHNTAYASQWADCFYANDGAGIVLRNNAFYSERNDALINIRAAAQAGFDSDYNVFYHEGAPNTAFKWGIGSYATLVLWRVQSGTDANSQQDNPDFVNAAGLDFHLQAVSPCRGAGVIGLGVVIDYDGVARGSPPDIGAFEYTRGGGLGSLSGLSGLCGLTGGEI